MSPEEAISDRIAFELSRRAIWMRYRRHAYSFMLDSELLNPLLEKARAAVIRMSKELEIEE